MTDVTETGRDHPRVAGSARARVDIHPTTIQTEPLSGLEDRLGRRCQTHRKTGRQGERDRSLTGDDARIDGERITDLQGAHALHTRHARDDPCRGRTSRGPQTHPDGEAHHDAGGHGKQATTPYGSRKHWCGGRCLRGWRFSESHLPCFFHARIGRLPAVGWDARHLLDRPQRFGDLFLVHALNLESGRERRGLERSSCTLQCGLGGVVGHRESLRDGLGRQVIEVLPAQHLTVTARQLT